MVSHTVIRGIKGDLMDEINLYTVNAGPHLKSNNYFLTNRYVFDSKHVSRNYLDTISVARSLFKGTVIDFGDERLHFRGGTFANRVERD